MEGIGDAVSGGIAMTTTDRPDGPVSERATRGQGFVVAAPSRGSARIGPNGGALPDIS